MRFTSSCAAVTSTSTRKSKLRARSDSSQIRSETSPGDRPCTKTWVGVITCGSAISGSVTDTRFKRSVVLMRRDLPTITHNGTGPSLAAGACGGAAVPCPTQIVQKSSTMSIGIEFFSIEV